MALPQNSYMDLEIDNASGLFTLHSLADIILHIAFVGSFVIIFFFFYASFIERIVVQSETTEIVKDLSSQISALLSDDENKNVRTQMQNLQYPDMSGADASVASQNKKLLKQSLILLAIGIGIAIVLIGICWYFGNFSIKELFSHNLVALISVAVTDFTFLTVFARVYRPSDSSVVKKTTFTAVENWYKAQPH